MMEEESEDHLSLRREEIVALSSIYEELQLNADGLSGTVVIPIEPDKPVPIACGEREGTVKFLPGIEFIFSTSAGYPETEPPSVSLKCIWLSDERLQSLREDIISLIWMSTNDLCLFDLVDEISERSKNVFGLEFLDISEQVFDELVIFSERQQTKIFEQGVYYCEVCLENKKGVDSFKLPRCGHIFCKECLRDYYGMCITEGLVNQVICMETSCAKSLTTPPRPSTKQDYSLLPFLPALAHLPSTLAAIFPSNPETVTRYIRLVKQKFYERTATTVYCPRETCQAPNIPANAESQVIVCSRCSYPFCKFCRGSWHGPTNCKPANGLLEKYREASEEDKVVMERMYGKKVLERLLAAWQKEQENERAYQNYINDNAMACPQCTLVFQKIGGCNKMTCPSCGTKFCYLCGSVLPARNPYVHYSPDNRRGSKFCKGNLFYGVDEEGRQVALRRDILRQRQQGNWQEEDEEEWTEEDEEDEPAVEANIPGEVDGIDEDDEDVEVFGVMGMI